MTCNPGISTGRSGQDFLARFAFVGIFIVENVLHAIHFEFEVDQMVLPAVAPLPYVPSRPSWWHTKPKKMGPQNGGFPKSPFFVGKMIVDHQIAVPSFPCQMSNFFVLQNRSVECHGDKTQWDPKAKYSGNNLSIA